MYKDQRGSHVILVMVLIVVMGVVGFAGYTVYKKNQKKDPGTNSAQFSQDAVTRGKYLSNNNCEGAGSKKLNAAPMKPSDISVILPYGHVAGGHVTPVDHQYFYGKNQKAARSTYDVFAPSSGTLVSIEVRPGGGPGSSDIRGVISYSCTFFSYFDLVNSLSDEISAQLPSGWQTKYNGPQSVKIPVKEGQVIARVGGQSLDYAVWDTTKTQEGLLVAKAYNNYEPWKIATVPPLDYYTDSVKNALLPYYVRTAEPRDGKLAYDVDGKAVGSWFKKGTNGYIGAFKEKDFNHLSYADGHLALIPSNLDPTGWVFSTGAINHGTQYGIKSPSVTPDKLDTKSGVVKYELTQYEHIDQTGSLWQGGSVPTSIKLNTSGRTVGTVLVQLTEKRELKVETFIDKTPSQVSSFTDKAITYTRGDEATTMMGPDQQ